MSSSETEQEFLRKYNIHDFDVPLTSVDLVIFTIREQALHVLLVKRGEHPHKGRWALPGGFIDIRRDRDLDATALRKLREKTGVEAPISNNCRASAVPHATRVAGRRPSLTSL